MYNVISKEKELIIYGHDPITGYLTPTKELIDFGTFIEKLDIESKPYRLNQLTKEQTIKEAKEFFNRHFKLHKIPYKGELRCDIDLFILKNIPGITIPLKLHNISRQIHPFDLPVKFISESITECMVVQNTTYIDNLEFLRNMKLSYKEIILPPTITSLTPSSYVHEITHTQLSHIKGIIREYYNSEVLSIFLEILSVHESPHRETLIPLQDAYRLTELYENISDLESYTQNIKDISDEDLIEESKYSTSIIKAYGLFVEYYYGTPSLKKYILTSIQNIINGDLQLEELLDEFELDINRVVKEPKVKKYFTR